MAKAEREMRANLNGARQCRNHPPLCGRSDHRGKIDSAARYVWEDVVEQVPLPGQGCGLEGLKDIFRAMRTGFPDIVFSIKEQITQGDKVASRFEWTGTHKGELLGIAATDWHVRVWGIVFDRLENRRIKDTRIIMDTLGLMNQVGALSSRLRDEV